jgi:hypothetical protein
MAGVDISYIDEAAQNEIYRYFFDSDNKCKLDLKSSGAIKQAFKDGKPINADTLAKLLNKEQSKQRAKPFSINRNRFKDFADRLPDDTELENLFLLFLKERFGMEV